jgi:hypothetical protein
MKKKFLSCFFLAAFLWGQTAPVMAMPQRDYLEVNQSDGDIGYRLTFYEQHKKAIIAGTTALLTVAVGTGIGIGIASALGVFSRDNSAFPLDHILSTDQPRQIIMSDGENFFTLSERRNPNNYDECPDGTYPSVDTIRLDLPYQVIETDPSFLSGCGELFVQKDRRTGSYQKCQGYRPLPIPAWTTCPDKHSDSPLLYGLNSEFEGTGYVGDTRQMGYEEFRDYLKENNHPFTHGMRIQDPSGNTVIVNANFDGELFVYGCIRKSSGYVARQCPPGTIQRGVHKFDEHWEQRYLKKIKNMKELHGIDSIVKLGNRGVAYKCNPESDQTKESQTITIARDLTSFFTEPYNIGNQIDAKGREIIRKLEEYYEKSDSSKHQSQPPYGSCYCTLINGIEKCSASIFVQGNYASCLDRQYTCKSDNLFFIQNLYYKCLNGALYLKDSLLQKSMNGGSSGLLSSHAQNNGLSKKCPQGFFEGILSMFSGDQPGTTHSVFCEEFSDNVSSTYGKSGKFYCNNNGYVANCQKFDPCGSAGGRLEMSGTFGNPKECRGAEGGELCLEGLKYSCDSIRF